VSALATHQLLTRRTVLRLQITLASAAACLLLSGCTQWQAAAGDTVRSFIKQSHPADELRLRSDLQYLRVTTNGVPALLVLGDVDPSATPSRPVQVWYSAEGEVLRLQDGRLAGLTGTPVEWRNVALQAPAPAWPIAPTTVQNQYQYQRQRDTLPGDHIGITEVVTVRPITAPSRHQLVQLDPGSLQWFEETSAPPADAPAALATTHRPLPPARYALRRTPTGLVPVYGEQCLNADLCIQWQSWPPAPAQP